MAFGHSGSLIQDVWIKVKGCEGFGPRAFFRRILAGQGPALAHRAGDFVLHGRPLQCDPGLDRSSLAVRPGRGPRRTKGCCRLLLGAGKLVGILDTLDIASYVVDLEAAGKRSTLRLMCLLEWLSLSGVIANLV